MRELFRDLPPPGEAGEWFRAVFSRRPHPLLQFIRYGLAGVLAMAANLLFFTLCEKFLFPVEDVAGTELSAAGGGFVDFFHRLRGDPRVANYVRCNAVAFLAANLVAYLLNFKWVFQSGRHSRAVEVSLFFTVSLLAFLAGTALAGQWVNRGVNAYLAKAGDVVAAVLVNYVCRKFFIFKN